MRTVEQLIKKYGNKLLLFFAVFNVSQVANRGCIFIFHQPELPDELKRI